MEADRRYVGEGSEKEKEMLVSGQRKERGGERYSHLSWKEAVMIM